MRHAFCVHTLEQMQAKGFDLYTSLPLLSVYLGHKHITETEYYLRLVDECHSSMLDSGLSDPEPKKGPAFPQGSYNQQMETVFF